MRNRKLLNLCSNDYLGLASRGPVPGQPQASSRLVSGSDPAHTTLEKALARHAGTGAALLYPTGYMANLGAIQALVRKGDRIFSDELNHASIIDACALSGGRVSVYAHNDMDELRRMLKRCRGRAHVITEGVFSMDGDMAKLIEITELARGRASVILDDAHGDFVCGRSGRGTAELLGVRGKVDVYTSSLSKGLGSFGGYMAAGRDDVKLCINGSRAFIYTSALPAHIARDALRRISADAEPRRRKLAENARRLSEGLLDAGFRAGSDSHIIPVHVGGERAAVELGRQLAREGVFAQPVRYPSVPRGKARIRISATARLTKGHVEGALEAFGRAGRRLGLV
ncbi:8-amino-7-oxononanoate synthase [Cenarchaeum symbiosum A]|uniref:8-amino-7-oxononanoate synthase n=1 Tax=Cenarchaeum symbiosum (strain A) TaxID=414004 RepID=A0RW97_CENSY|nr:8-amino-7-oxononanoate synthase [Cenarchaeum symbiosum A]